MKKEILVLDLETTGFVPAKDEILEIGIVKIDLSTGRKAKIFDNVIRPIKTPEDILRKCWIVKTGAMSVEEFDTAYTLEDFRPLIQYIFDSFPLGVTAFNSSFDIGFLEGNNFTLPKKLPCLMKTATPVCKIPNANGYKGFKWPNVDEAYKFFYPDTTYKEIHRGGDDAFHEADISYELYKLGEFKIDLEND